MMLDRPQIATWTLAAASFVLGLLVLAIRLLSPTVPEPHQVEPPRPPRRARVTRAPSVLPRPHTPISPAEEPVAPEALYAVPEPARRTIIRALLLPRNADRWDALAQVGIQPTSDDFRGVLDGLGDDWKASNEARNILGQWLQVDANEATEWVVHQPRSLVYTQAVRHVADVLAHTDLQHLVAWSQQIPPGALRDHALSRYITQISILEPETAEAQLAQMSNDKIRIAAIRAVTSGYAQQNVTAVENWIARLPPGIAQDTARQQAAGQLAASDPTRALAWAEAIENPALQPRALQQVVGAWTRVDVVGAAAYVKDLPHGALRDKCIQAHALQLAANVPALAYDWAITIEDPRTRVSVLSSIGYKWARSDPEGAAVWLKDVDLPEATRKQISAHIERARKNPR